MTWPETLIYKCRILFKIIIIIRIFSSSSSFFQQLTAKKLGEQCLYHQICEYNDPNSLCVQIKHNAICECAEGFHSVSYMKPTKRIFCTQGEYLNNFLSWNVRCNAKKKNCEKLNKNCVWVYLFVLIAWIYIKTYVCDNKKNWNKKKLCHIWCVMNMIKVLEKTWFRSDFRQ